jgi:hypothetical protein
VTKDFSIKAPFIIPNSETIYVNNVALTKGTDYEIDYENNFCDMRENYHTAGLTCRMDNVSFGNLKTAAKERLELSRPYCVVGLLRGESVSFLLYGKRSESYLLRFRLCEGMQPDED